MEPNQICKLKLQYEKVVRKYQISQEFLEKEAEQVRKQAGSEGIAECFSFLKGNWMNHHRSAGDGGRSTS